MCTLVLCNKLSLDKFGIKLNAINENTLSIYSIPKCFITNKQYYNDIKLAMTIRNLLNEIVDNIMNGNGTNFLPLSIHNAISMEACHGIYYLYTLYFILTIEKIIKRIHFI